VKITKNRKYEPNITISLNINNLTENPKNGGKPTIKKVFIPKKKTHSSSKNWFISLTTVFPRARKT
jgi:hypothetical protein